MARPALPRILCIGVDVTWWGGSRRLPASRAETIVSATLDAPHPCEIQRLELSPEPNPRAHLATEPNFDAEGALLCAAIVETAASHPGVDHVVVCLDAPLECRERKDQPMRRKTVSVGEKTGSLRRTAEGHLSDSMRGLDPGASARWNRDLRIQAGSPIPPRIAKVVDRLSNSPVADLRPYRSGAAASPRGVVEVFPSEAIWAPRGAGLLRRA